MQKLIWVLWPSFVVAGVGAALVFSAVDPGDLRFVDGELVSSPLGAYSIGFFLLWGICAVSSMATCFFQRTAASINSVFSGRKHGVGRNARLEDRGCAL
jgi:hypothetical protein